MSVSAGARTSGIQGRCGRWLATCGLLVSLLPGSGAADSVWIRSADVPPSAFKIRMAERQGQPRPQGIPGPMVKADLERPDGEGPFPAILLFPTLGGWEHTPAHWIDRLNAWGYVTVELHSFEARDFSSPRDRRASLRVPKGEFVLDAIGAVRYLRSVPFVDPDRIAIMGWSYGGSVALWSIDEVGWAGHYDERFRGAVAFYPTCENSGRFESPALILHGELDDESRAVRCVELAGKLHGDSAPVELTIYPGAYHKFDDPDRPRWVAGRFRSHYYAYDAEATADAVDRVRAFLAKVFE